MATVASELACLRPRLAAQRSGVQRRQHLVPSCSAWQQPQGSQDRPQGAGLQQQRRSLLLGSLLLAGAAALPVAPSKAADEVAADKAAAAPASSSSSSQELVLFSNPSQGYTLLRPTSWEQVGKAGADSLFRDPAKKSTTVGVTVYPVTISSLEQFGDLQTVGERLLNAEREKESTLDAAMVAQSARTDPAGGFSIYDFEYELDSTRGRKRIFSTVAIAGRKLYIANGNVSCGKNPSCEGVEAALPLVRQVTQSMQIGSGQ